jgi:GGDEF domain-containing protein
VSAAPVRVLDAVRVRPTLFGTFVGTVVVLGNLLLLYGVTVRAAGHLDTVDETFVLLATLLVAAELRPLSVQRRSGDRDSISLSGAFACALLLHHDWSLVAVVLAVGSLLDDRRARTTLLKAGFNVGQYVLSLGAASAVLGLSGLWNAAGGQTPPLALALLSCAAFFLVNTALPGTAMALQDGADVLRSLRSDLPLQWSVNGVVVAMAPLVVAVANDSLWLVGLLVVPVLAVHRGAVSVLEREHMTLHDPLTGLPNQIAFQQRLVEQLEAADRRRARRRARPRPRPHRRRQQHPRPSAAEELLEQVARRLRTTVPQGAVLARSSGGGFAVAVPGLRSPWEASACAEALLEQFSDPYDVVESAFALRASVGLTVSPLHGTDPEQLVQHAEVARGVALRSRSGSRSTAPSATTSPSAAWPCCAASARRCAAGR